MAPRNWRASTWGDEITLEYGKALRGYDGTRGRFRVFGSNGPIGWTDEALVPGPGVILGRKGAYRGVEFSSDPFFVIDTAYFVVPKTELDLRWLYYAIKHHKLGEIDDGSPIPSTTRAAVYMRELDVPPIQEQRAIARTLEGLDVKIELNRKMNETLEAIARALFKSWFVDFDPVRAKAAGRAPAGMDAATAALFPSEFVDSDLGPIPKGWSVSEFGKQFSWSRETVDPAHEPETLFEHFSIPAFDAGRRPSLELGQRIKSLKFRVKPDSVLISKLNPTIPRVWVPTGALKNAICSTEFLVALPNSMSPHRLALMFNSESVREAMVSNASGTSNSHQRVRPSDIEAVRTCLPPAALGAAFDAMTRPFSERQSSNISESSQIKELRDTLLPRLLNGELSPS